VLQFFLFTDACAYVNAGIGDESEEERSFMREPEGGKSLIDTVLHASLECALYLDSMQLADKVCVSTCTAKPKLQNAILQAHAYILRLVI
jgi:hypothetical protein